MEKGKQLELGERNETITFNCYLAELLSNEEIKALNHQVEYLVKQKLNVSHLHSFQFLSLRVNLR